MGRPSDYTEEIADRICDLIADGKGLREICRGEGMPGRRTVLDWLNDDSKGDFRARYARAREAQGDFLDEEMQSVADTATPETAHVARLRVDTMKWRASKLAPKKYGDKVETVHSGELRVGRIERVIVRPPDSNG